MLIKISKLIEFIKLIPQISRANGGYAGAIKKTFQLLSVGGFELVKKKALCSTSQIKIYQNSITNYDNLSNEQITRLKSRIDGFKLLPTVSVVMPTYNSDPKWLEEAIESVRSQIYPNWELCIADDQSTNGSIPDLLTRYASLDCRIKIIIRSENGHISAASNSALELASGEWIALLDHDDLLSQCALFWVVDAINQNPNLKMIYSDEDKIDGVGVRANPYFKCDWNIDLFYSQNMFSHLGAYSSELIRAVGGFRVGYEGSQDYDLALRCIEKIQPEQIFHIPRVLYHWRSHENSTASSNDVKPYALIAGQRALNEHFKRVGVDAGVELTDAGYRVRYALPPNRPKVSLIIPTYNGYELIKACLSSILERTTYPNYEILVVDNGSDDELTLSFLESVRAHPNVRILVDSSPFNYSYLNNLAVNLVDGDLVALINNDVEVISPDWLSEMVSIAIQPKVGAVGAKLFYPNNTLQHAGVILGIGGVAGHSHKHLDRGRHGYFGRASLISSFSAVTGACMVVERAIYLEAGGLNEVDLSVAYNDVDFCLRLKEMGYRNVWTPYAELYHHESPSRGADDTLEKKLRFQSEVEYMERRWKKLLENDPAYSPNLSLRNQQFEYALPPRVSVI